MVPSELLLQYLGNYFPILLFIFVALAFGVESLKDETLKFYRKVQTMEGVERGMKMINETNILLLCNFLAQTEALMKVNFLVPKFVRW